MTRGDWPMPPLRCLRGMVDLISVLVWIAIIFAAWLVSYGIPATGWP